MALGPGFLTQRHCVKRRAEGEGGRGRRARPTPKATTGPFKGTQMASRPWGKGLGRGRPPSGK